jgi:hypothetical protein
MKTITIQFYNDDGTLMENKKFTKVLFYGMYKDILKFYAKMVDIDPAILKLLDNKNTDVKKDDLKAIQTFCNEETKMFDDTAKFFADMFGGVFTAEEFEKHVPGDDALQVFSDILQMAQSGFRMGT